MSEQSDESSGHTPTSVRRLSTPEAAELAGLASVFEDLQYVLRCCEHLITALSSPTTGPLRVESDPALVEALWTGALVGYSRCFSGQYKVLTDSDLGDLELDNSVLPMHSAYKKLRDTFASRHTNPRESFTVGVAQDDDGGVLGIAVTSTTTPVVDDQTVRLLGRVAYSLSGLIDNRMQHVQAAVLASATKLSPAELEALPEVQLSEGD